MNFLPTSSPALDQAAGGGFPRGKLTELFGCQNTARDLALRAVAAAQRAGEVCAWLDLPRHLGLERASNRGMSPSVLLVSQPDDPIQALAVAESLARSQAVGLVVVDFTTVGQVIGAAEARRIDGRIGRRMQACRKLASAASWRPAAVIFLTAGRGLNEVKFYSSLRVELSADGGFTTRKNKQAAPFWRGSLHELFHPDFMHKPF